MNSKKQLTPDQADYARYLDKTHGREAALAYLRMVTAPDYRSNKNLGKVRKSVNLAEAHRGKKKPRKETTVSGQVKEKTNG